MGYDSGRYEYKMARRGTHGVPDIRTISSTISYPVQILLSILRFLDIGRDLFG